MGDRARLFHDCGRCRTVFVPVGVTFALGSRQKVDVRDLSRISRIRLDTGETSWRERQLRWPVGAVHRPQLQPPRHDRHTDRAVAVLCNMQITIPKEMIYFANTAIFLIAK